MLFDRTHILYILISTFLTVSCGSKRGDEQVLFEALDSKRTGLDFRNDLHYTPSFNLFKYIYFYNGSGVGAGDFNNDGRIDLFFGSNQQQNKIYLNKGGLRFTDVTKEALLPQDGGWSTGISVVDINNDGLLDIYVCRVGQYETLHSKNQLLVNQGMDKNGVPRFKDQAKEYGLDFSGFSTQAAFLDYDGDGDLDMFLLNHSIHQNGTFRPRKEFEGTLHPLSGDRMYRKDGKTFTDVTTQTGINSTAIGYGLGIAVADINLDGYPDIYIGNDFHENDYLYINQKNGTFRQEAEHELMHTSQYSMGVDVADVNNDAFPEIISMDMLPADPYILKRSLGEDTYDLFHEKIGMGYFYQYTRNNLQYNRRNGLFSEVGLYSGVAATDWSWAPLFMDFDNDGLKDLFVSNGIPKRMNDIDYINFISNGEVQQKISEDNMKAKDLSLISKFPEIRLPNKFFRNQGELRFSDMEASVKGNEPGFSNGSAYADFDNDGDLDIVVNNIDDPVQLYENKSNNAISGSFMELKLKGSAANVNAVGAKVILFAGRQVRTYEKYAAKGFISSMEVPLLMGTKNTTVDSIILVWPDNTCQRVEKAERQQLSYQKGLPVFDYSILGNRFVNPSYPVSDLTAQTGLNYVHKENVFVEFDREPLIPHMVSTEGPALSVADINGDGLEDIYIGGARNEKCGIFIQQPSGSFLKKEQPVLDLDSSYENVSACWADVNHDTYPDLVVASAGNEFYGTDSHNTPRVYLNDGKANFSKLANPFGEMYLTAASVSATDVNGDGYADLFFAARAVPWEYGQIPQSYLLLNDRKGKFRDVTAKVSDDLARAGIVTQALWFDLDKDGDEDLLMALEWGPVVAYLNQKGRFVRQELTNKKGWWNFVKPCDIDNDGDVDLVAGNLGWNSRLKATPEKPVRLYYNDFDGNGKKEQLLTYYVGDKEIPFASKAELEKQMPGLKKQFLYAADFAKAGFTELFSKEKLDKAEKLSADYFANALLINNGNGQFETVALPWEAQLSPYKTAMPVDANGDSLPDLLLAGNYYDNNIEMGRYDADFGTVLLNKGRRQFECQPLNGLSLKTQVRHMERIIIKNEPAYLLACNNDSLRILQFTFPPKAVKLTKR